MVKVVKLFGVMVVFVLLLQVFLASATASGDYWISKKPIPFEQIPIICVTASNGMIYAIGEGINVMYDPVEDTWINKTPMPTSRSSLGIVAYQNKIYCIGGYIDSPGAYWGVKATGVNEVYDIATDTWETKKTLPNARGGLCAEVVDGKIYAIGGTKPLESMFDFNGFSSSLNEVYDIATDTWSSKVPPPSYLDLYGSAVIDKKIYVMPNSGSLMIYDVESNVWSWGARNPAAVVGQVLCATNGEMVPKRLFVIGVSFSLDDTVDVIEPNLIQVYDPETDTWTMGTSMPTSRYGMRGAVVDDCLYVIGGVDASSDRKPVNTVEMYIPLGHKNADLYLNSTSAPNNSLSSTAIIVIVVFIIVILVVGVVGVIVLRVRKRRI
jgi:hypothetical protein